MFTSFSIKADEKIEWLPEPSAPSAIHEEPLDTSLPKEEAKEDIVELT